MADATQKLEGHGAISDDRDRDDPVEDDDIEDDDDGSEDGRDADFALPPRGFRESERPPRSSSVLRTRGHARGQGRDGVASELRRGAIVAGKYRVGSVVRRTGIALTVRAFHRELGQNVTVTSLLPEGMRRPGLATEFLDAVRFAGRIDSEHAARVIDIGVLENGAPFSVTEALDGWSLYEVMCVRGALPVQEAVEYVIQAADAVAEAHRVGIMHRGLNLNNIALSRRADGSPRIKVSGFGGLDSVPIGSFDDESDGPRASAEFMTILPYLAPEQIRNRHTVDPRTDVWALGAILQTLLTGAPPFRASSKVALLAAVVADPALPIDAVGKEVSPDLEQIVVRCLEKEPEHRFASLGEFAVALRPYASGDALRSVERIARAGFGRGTEPPPLPIPRHRSIVPAPKATRAAAAAAAPAKGSAWWFVPAAFISALVGGLTAMAAGGFHQDAEKAPVAVPMPVQVATTQPKPVENAPVAAAAVVSTAIAPAATAAVTTAPVVASLSIPAATHAAEPTVSPVVLAPRKPVTAASHDSATPRASAASKNAAAATPAAPAPVAAASKDLFDDTK